MKMTKNYLLIKICLFVAIITLSQKTFAQCTVEYSPNNVSNWNSPGNTIGQGFIATCNGNLEYVQFISNGAVYVPAGNLKIYEGETLSAANTQLIHTQYIPGLTINNSGEPLRFNITGTLPITIYKRYIFEFVVDGPIKADNSGGFPDGMAFQRFSNGHLQEYNSYDFHFEVSILDPALSTADISGTENVKLFPNPTTNFIQVSALNSEKNFKIYNVLGEEVAGGKTHNNKKIDVSNLANGLYFLKFKDAKAIKFIKE